MPTDDDLPKPCDGCGRTIAADEITTRLDGLLLCPDCWLPLEPVPADE